MSLFDDTEESPAEAGAPNGGTRLGDIAFPDVPSVLCRAFAIGEFDGRAHVSVQDVYGVSTVADARKTVVLYKMLKAGSRRSLTRLKKQGQSVTALAFIRNSIHPTS